MFFKRRIPLYAFTLIGLLVLTYFIFNSVQEMIFPAEFNQRAEEYFDSNPPPIIKYGGTPKFKVVRNIPFMVITIFLLLLSSLVGSLEFNRKREEEASLLREENLNSELKFLKSQINPHFLFNALNNLYALSVAQSSKAPEVVLKLSDMLRYIIYECNDERVPISKEVQYIKNYIDLQLLKDDSISNITTHFEYESEEIPPMLLIPFVENAFKHSKIEDTSFGWIKISLIANSNSLHFEVANSLPTTHQKDAVGGIGIQNVKKRLELMYPDQETLEIDNSGETYRTSLKLNWT